MIIEIAFEASQNAVDEGDEGGGEAEDGRCHVGLAASIFFAHCIVKPLWLCLCLHVRTGWKNDERRAPAAQHCFILLL